MEREEGFTIIEVLVAAFILVLGAMAVFMTFAAALHNVQRSRETQIGISVAQREMEKAKVTPYQSLGLASTPQPSPVSTSPNNRVSGSRFNVVRKGEADYMNLIPGGTVPAETTGVRANDGTEVTVYRYVACEGQDETPTPTACLRKRIVIDVLPAPKADLGRYRHPYTELQSTVVDADATGG